MHHLDDYDYHLPPELIAQTAAHPPESCKLLAYARHSAQLQDRIFSDITDLIDPTTLIVFNNSKVIKARLQCTHPKANKHIEIFYLAAKDTHTFDALVRPGKLFPIGSTIRFNDDIFFTVNALTEDGRQLTCNQPILDVLETYGQMPLPPYISYTPDKAQDYQPVLAREL